MFIATASNKVRIHSFPEGDLVYNYSPTTKIPGPVRSISWSKDGTWLSIISKSGSPEIISIRNQLRLLHTVSEIEDPASTAFQNTTRKFIAFGTKTGQTLLYDVKQKKIKHRFPRSSSMITHIEFTARDTHVVVGCLAGEVNVFSCLTNSLSCSMSIPRSRTVTALRTNPLKRNLVAGGSFEGVVVVWDTNVNKRKATIETHKAAISGVAFSPNNPDLLLTAGDDRQFCCHDVISNKCIAAVTVDNCVNALDFSHDGTHFVLATQEGTVSIYDSRKILEPLHTFEGDTDPINKVSFQKQDVSNSNSSILENVLVSERQSRHEEDAGQNVSFGNLLSHSPEAGDVAEGYEASGSPSVVDSFMAGLGLNRENSSEQSVNREGSDYNSYTKEDYNRLSLYKRRSLSIKQASTSTPTFPQIVITKMESAVSPIVNQLNDTTNNNKKKETNVASLEQIEKMVEDAVEKKLSQKLNVFCNDIKNQFSNTNSQMRQMHLDMMMAHMKDFIKLDESLKLIREDVQNNPALPENNLLEENRQLKKRIAVLEKKLKTADFDM